MGRLNIDEFVYILASASPRRQEILSERGLEFILRPSNCEEKISTKNPKKAVKKLALLKAEEVALRSPEKAIIIGADTLVACKGEIMGKPRDERDAFRMLEKLQGSSQRVYTGVAVLIVENGRVLKKKVFYEKTMIYMKAIPNDWIERYIESKEPMDKAGAYAIQGKADRWIRKIKGDYNNVVGLPDTRVFKEIKRLFY